MQKIMHYFPPEYWISHGGGLVRKIIGNSPQMLSLYHQINLISDTPSTVLIQGETGTGKELIAMALHFHGKGYRKEKPFIAVNCASIPDGLLECELFGAVKGAYTDAYRNHPGKFEQADNGTLFLDEIGSLSQSNQAKVLDVLQTNGNGNLREFWPIGARGPKEVNVRIIAATNRDLYHSMQEGTFREDLWYRLNVCTIYAHPLRERKSDIRLIAEYLIKKYNEREMMDVKGLSESAVKKLESYDWPGNVRELENIIERAVAIKHKGIIDAADIMFDEEFFAIQTNGSRPQTVDDHVALAIAKMLESRNPKNVIQMRKSRTS